MARLCAVADGNNTSASTWGLIDSTSFNESETTAITVPTTYSTGYTQFTPGAITVDGIGVRLNNRSGTTGTFSVELYNHTAAGSVAGTEVTVNCSDFVDGVAGSFDGGWMFFKFSSPVTLLAANAYSVRFKTSSSNQIVCQGASATNPSRMLRTTTTQAPTTGDDRYVMGEWTAASTTTTRTVTLNDTGAAVDYGSASTSQVTPALSISAGGIVLAGTTSATTYVQKISGNVVVYNGGILRLATSGSRMPTNSSFTWTFDCVANVDFGIDVRRKAEFSAYGESKTRWTSLTGDEAAGQTVIEVADTTGWKTGDVLVFAPTGTTITQGETKTILTVDSSVQVTLTAGLTNAHTGTGDVVGKIGNITSNVKIAGTSSTVGTFICYKESSLGVLDNVEVQFFGSATTNKRGVECQHINTSTNSCTFESCVFNGLTNASATIGNVQTAGNLYYITNCVITSSSSGVGITAAGGSAGTPTFDISNNLVTGQSTGLTTGGIISVVTGTTGICKDNIIAGCTTGVSINTTLLDNTTTTLSGFKIHSCTNGLTSTTAQNKVISSFSVVCNSVGLILTGGITQLNNCDFIGNSIAGYNPVGIFIAIQSSVTFDNCTFRGRTSFNQPAGFLLNNAYTANIRTTFNSCTFGATVAHTTADVSITTLQGSTIVFNNCTFSSTTEFSATTYSFLNDEASFQIQKKDGTSDNVMYIRQAIITSDTSIYRTASPSIRLSPKSSTIPCTTKLLSFKTYVNNGQTCTPTVYVRESVVGDGTDYNGNRVKLYVKANVNLGITTDTLLDTATIACEGAFEALTGTTSAVTDNGVLEFYLVADGTTGWINIDDFTAVNA